MHYRFIIRSIWISAIFLLVAGCVRSSIRSSAPTVHAGVAKPEQILICNFAASQADVRENASLFAKIGRTVENKDQSAEEIRLGHEAADALASELTKKIAGMGLNAVRVTTDTPFLKGAVLITGHFINIDEGNSLRRNVIGLGAGKSSLDCSVSILAEGSAGLYEIHAFHARIDSGKMPGAAVMGPAGAATGANTGAVVAINAGISGVKTYKSEVSQLSEKLADNIASELEKYFKQQGWIR